MKCAQTAGLWVLTFHIFQWVLHDFFYFFSPHEAVNSSATELCYITSVPILSIEMAATSQPFSTVEKWSQSILDTNTVILHCWHCWETEPPGSGIQISTVHPYVRYSNLELGSVLSRDIASPFFFFSTKQPIQSKFTKRNTLTYQHDNIKRYL